MFLVKLNDKFNFKLKNAAQILDSEPINTFVYANIFKK